MQGAPPLKQRPQVIKLRDVPDSTALIKKRQKSIQTAQIQVRPKNLSGQVDMQKLSDAPNLPGIAQQNVLDKRRQSKHKYMPSQMGPRRQVLNNTNLQHGSINLGSGYNMSTTHNESHHRQEKSTNDRHSHSQVAQEMPTTTLNIKMDGIAAKVSEF